MDPADVFVHRGYPEHTYVEREEPTKGKGSFEDQLYSSLRKGYHVKISGPSKSGKTQLVLRVARNRLTEEAFMKIKGSNIDSKGDLSSEAVDLLPLPDQSTTIEGEKETESLKAKIAGRLGLVSSEVTGGLTQTEIQELQEVTDNTSKSLSSLLQSVENENLVVLIDNFHYIDSDVREGILQTIRDLKTSFCIAMIPHRMDDVYLGNQDLAGRVKSIELKYWDQDDLEQIGMKGFSKLNIEFTDDTISRLAKESVGSPQLMQQMCQSLCIDTFGMDDSAEPDQKFSTTRDDIARIAEEVVSTTQAEKIFRQLKSGKNPRGQKRVGFPVDNGIADGYTLTLRAIGQDPLIKNRVFDVGELEKRINKEILGDAQRTKQNISNDCDNMKELMNDKFPNDLTIEWDEKEEQLAISNPNLFFYIRWVSRDELTDRRSDIKRIKGE
jgi:hypothetical protein